MTSVASMDQAVVRLRRTAEKLCKGRAYRLSEPEIVEHGWASGAASGRSTFSVRSYLTRE